MLTIGDWKKWFLYQLIGNGVHNVIYHEKILNEIGKHYDINLDRALRELIDDGIIMLIESKKEKKYVVNFERLTDAQKIINRNNKTANIFGNVSLKDNITGEKIDFLQPYLSEPSGYIYWFENEDNRKFRKQSVYRIYVKETDKMNFCSTVNYEIS